jgi:glycosyltransferase involved in cell wall biosynthesis
VNILNDLKLSTTVKPRVAFVVNGDMRSPMGQRATEFQSRLADRFEIHVGFRQGGRGFAVMRFLKELRSFKPELICVFDHSIDGVIASHLYRYAGKAKWILDTGDDIVALGQALGRGHVAMFVTRWLDKLGYASASHVVVRGRGHIDAIAHRTRNVTWIPDGVNLQQFSCQNPDSLAEPSSTQPLTIGLLGSSVWSEAKQMCYGQELVELIYLLRSDSTWSIPVRGEMIGDGSGIEWLRRRAQELGISDSISFLGRQPYDALPEMIQRWHVCLSTQTDDAIGRVRTTGKMPLYLAAGRFILASNVGEAGRVLPESMLVSYEGQQDPNYPQKLAERVRLLIQQGTNLGFRSESVDIAKRYFDYDMLAEKYGNLMQDLLE